MNGTDRLGWTVSRSETRSKIRVTPKTGMLRVLAGDSGMQQLDRAEGREKEQRLFPITGMPELKTLWCRLRPSAIVEGYVAVAQLDDDLAAGIDLALQAPGSP